MYNLNKSLAHDLRDLTKEELFADIKTATSALQHARRDYEREKPLYVLEAVLGELNVRFPGWQQEFYPPSAYAALVKVMAVRAQELATAGDIEPGHYVDTAGEVRHESESCGTDCTSCGYEVGPDGYCQECAADNNC